jgi:hypothetical protein
MFRTLISRRVVVQNAQTEYHWKDPEEYRDCRILLDALPEFESLHGGHVREFERCLVLHFVVQITPIKDKWQAKNGTRMTAVDKARHHGH